MTLENAAARLGDLALQRPGRVAAVVLAVLAVASALWPRFEIEPDVASLFAADDPLLRLVADLPSRGTSARDLFVVVRGENVARELPAVVAALAASPLVEAVHATPDTLLGELLTAARRTPLAFVDAAVLDRLDAQLAPAGRATALADARATLARDPLGGRELVTRDPLGLRWILDEAVHALSPVALATGTEYVVLANGRTGLVRIRGREPSFDIAYSNALLADLELRLAAHDVAFLGGYAIARSEAAQVRADLESSTIVSALLVAAYLAWTLRSVFRPLLVLLPVGLGVFCSLPIGAALAGPLTPLAISAAAILIGLGVDFPIHWIAAWDARRRAVPDEAPADAVRATQREVARPLVVGFVTTAVAFGALGLTGFPGLFGFALLLVLGLGVAVGATLSVVPWLVARGRSRAVAPRTWTAAWRDRLVCHPAARRIAGVATVATFTAVAITLTLQPPTIACDPRALRPDDDAHDAARAALAVELGFDLAPRFALFALDTDLEAVANALDTLRRDSVLAFDAGPQRSIVPRARITRLAAFRAAHADFVAATLDDLRAAGFAPEPFRAGLERFAELLLAPPPTKAPAPTVLADGTAHYLVTCWVPATAPESVEPLRQALLAAHAPPIEGLLGPRSVADHLSTLLAFALRIALTWAAVLTSLVVLVALGTSGALALLPVTLAVPAVLAVLAVSGIAIDQATFVALPFLVGLGLDDGVHLVARHRRDPAGACPPGVTGDACERTSVTSILGFGSLATAASPGLSSLGILLACGTAACLVAALFVLPPLLRRTGRGLATTPHFS